MNRRSVAVVWALMWAACSGAPESAGRGPAGGVDALVLSMFVEVAQDSVRIALHGTNPTEQPILLEQGNGSRLDVEVFDSSGVAVWRWPADGGGAGVVGPESVAPSGTVRYEVAWQPGARRGTYTVVARLVTLGLTREERTEFEI